MVGTSLLFGGLPKIDPLLLIGGGLAATKLVPGVGRLVGLASIAYGVAQLAGGVSDGVTEGVTGDLGTTTLHPEAPPNAFQINILEPAWQEAVSGPALDVTVELKNPWSQPIEFQPVVTVTESETKAKARAVADAPISVPAGTKVTKRLTVDVSSIPLQGTVFGVLGGASTLTVEVIPVPSPKPGMDADSRVAVLVS